MSMKRRGGRAAWWLGAAAYLSLIGLVGLTYVDSIGALSGIVA